MWNEAVKINGADPDYHRRDLWDAIQTGAFPEWELGLQLFDQKFADKFDFDVLDPTKLIPEELLPVRIVGRLVLDRMVDNFFAETEQVAFCTQNVPPGIDFSNDPLLQGRNFSYLDTQIKRLGGPNFTHIPINAPRCPFAHFQQDGHMAMRNPKGRANYQPNSWGDDGGPRANPTIGFRSFREEVEGTKTRTRPESFADHYSQARQFFVSQTPIEQKHLGDALVFELSKVERPDIRERMVAHLRNIHDDLAGAVAKGLGIELPKPARAAQATRKGLKPSPALSIVERGPQRFEGRKLGILATDGADAALFAALTTAVTKAGGVFEVIAPKIVGVTLSDGELVPAKQKIDGGPSVLYDAVALLLSAEGSAHLVNDAPSNDFVRDAFAHCKFIAYVEDAQPLLEAAGIASKLDEGCMPIASRKDAPAFVQLCGRLRHWERELAVDLDAEGKR
jgi:catalase